MGWLYELLSIASIVLTPILTNSGVPNIHWIDAIIMFFAIPFVHLLNDEETKGIISEENWYEGIRHLLGIYIKKPPQNLPQALPQRPTQNSNAAQSCSASSKPETSISSAKNKVLTRQYNSMTCLVPSQTSNNQKILPLKRRHSFTHHFIEAL